MSRPATLALLALALASVVLGALPAAAERTQSDFVLIREGETVSEDLYAAGDVILIAGLIEGDLGVKREFLRRLEAIRRCFQDPLGLRIDGSFLFCAGRGKGSRKDECQGGQTRWNGQFSQ